MDLSRQRGGLLRGERVFNQYREIMPETEIENCSRRFAAVATNLSTGRELWFTEGDLHLAIRASCSIRDSWHLLHITATGWLMEQSLTQFLFPSRVHWG